MSNRNSTVMRCLRDHEDVFLSDGSSSSVYCKVCEVKVSADKPQSVQQHLRTIKHAKLAGLMSSTASEPRRNSVGKSLVTSTSVHEAYRHGGGSADDVRVAAREPMTPPVPASPAADGKSPAADKRSPFARDLCRALMYADVPLAKLSVPEFRSFVEKYALHAVPGEAELRKTYADDCYRDALARLRRRLVGKKVWASLDETVDPADGELVGTVAVGTLSPDGPGETFLLAAGVLRGGGGGGGGGDDDADADAARLFDGAMGLLWPDGVRHGDVFLLLLRSASRRTAVRLAPAYAKMVSVACVARELHAAAEQVCADHPAVDSLVTHAHRVFARDPERFARLRAVAPGVPPPPRARVPDSWPTWIEAARYLNENLAAVRRALTDLGQGDPAAAAAAAAAGSARHARRLVGEPATEPGLAFVDANYGFLPAKVAQLEARGAPLTRAVAAVFEVADRLAEVDGDSGTALHRRFAAALADNDGFQVLVKISDIMAGRSATMHGLPSHLSGNDLKYFKYAPVAAVNVRADFPRFEAIFSRENRRAYGEDSVNKSLVVQCNNFSSDHSAPAT